MEHILNEYCKQFNPGLLLLSMPTGSGKTYKVLNFIYSNYEEFTAKQRKIWFITNLKKNLPINELKERFIADGKEDEFDKHVLFINSNVDTVINKILDIDDEIHDQFKTEIYQTLKSYIKILQNSHLPKEVKDRWETEIRTNIEPKFRKTIREVLKKNFKTKKDRLSAIKNDQDYQWIGKLYPAVFTDEKTILFLTIDKFVSKNTTLVEPSYYFSEKLINEPLIFIDEFDTTKEAVLKTIIESDLKHGVDLLDLFLNIHNHLMPNECREVLIKESEWFQKKSGGKNYLSPRQQIESFREKANHIFTKYKLQHTCKSHEEFSTKQRNFLFYDYEFHNVMDRNKRIEIIEDSQNRTNWIKAFDIKTTKTGIDIRSLLNEITGFLTYFQRGIWNLADNYRHSKNENKSINEVFSIESAVKSVLNNFRLDDTDVEFLTSKILEDDLSYSLQTDKGIIQRQGFYDTGFRYHDIVDSDEHDTLSKIYMFNFSRTPESFLAGVCSKAMVVGISATAGLYTNIGNYDLKYLKSRLGNSFIRLKEDAILRLKNAYSEATKGYDQVVIKTEFIGTDSQKEAIKQLEELLRDREAAQDLWNGLRHKNTDDNEESIEFSFRRYVRALTAWKYFLDHPDCYAFLCLFNKFPKPSDPKFDRKILYEYAKLLLDDKKDVIDGSVSDTIFLLSTDNFDEDKKKLLNELKDNKRRFIISAYQTIGVGQNLQLPIPSSIEPIHINSLPKHSHMDINGIYLDNPTNLLVNILGNDIENKNFIKYIFQLEFFRENGALSLNQFKSKLDQAFDRYIGTYKPKRKTYDISLYNTVTYSLFLNKIIIQAIGRICRTNMKAPTIHILADASMRKHLTRFSIPEDVIPVREYTALLESSGESTRQSEDLIEAQNRASHNSNQSYAYIRRQLNTPWTLKTIKEWQNLREQVLRQPAIAKESECNPNWNGIIYVELPKAVSSYRYLEEYDYKESEVFFSDGYGKKEVKEVSERTARLSDLMRIDILHKLFIDSGWATTFPESELMLTPPIFNNIYKGALGEVCGKHIFQSLLNIDLRELDVDEFECFDFKTEQNIYIDFKLWNDRVAVPADKLIDKIREKMAIVKAERVFVINILGSSDTAFGEIIQRDRKIVEVPYLCKNDKVDDKAIEFILKEFHK